MTTDSSAEGGATPGFLQVEEDESTLREEIRTMVRSARQELGLTQDELGKRISVSRFTINRFEAGATDITLPQAEQLEQVLGLSRLKLLVARRDRQITPTSNGRDAVVTRLLSTPGLTRLRIVLADDMSVYPLIISPSDDDAVLRSADVEIVVPTMRRERTLLGGQSSLYRHIEYQLKRLLDLKKSDRYAANSLRLYESDDVIASIIIAENKDGTEGAIWPPLMVPSGQRDAKTSVLPVGLTLDHQAVAQLESHIDAIIADRDPLSSNDAICRVSEAGSEPVFTRYFTVGEHQEEDVDESEGIAVALIMVVALCPRKRHGVGRRVIVYRRSNSLQDRRRSLFSNTVEDIDLQRSRAMDTGTEVSDLRSTRRALIAALDINDYLDSHSKVIPNLAFQLAAAREMAMFDLDVPPSRFQPVRLPEELRLVRKPATATRNRAAIAPRLFVLELEADQAEHELAALQLRADVDEVGVLDLLQDNDLNDFLLDARNSGFLESLLRSYGIADR